MLAELDEDGSVLLKGTQRAFGAPQMARLEVLVVALLTATLEGVSVAGRESVCLKQYLE